MKIIILIIILCASTQVFSQTNSDEVVVKNISGIGSSEDEAKLNGAKNAIFQVFGGNLTSVYLEKFEKIVENYLEVKSDGYTRIIGNEKSEILPDGKYKYTADWAVSKNVLTQDLKEINNFLSGIKIVVMHKICDENIENYSQVDYLTSALTKKFEYQNLQTISYIQYKEEILLYCKNNLPFKYDNKGYLDNICNENSAEFVAFTTQVKIDSSSFPNQSLFKCNTRITFSVFDRCQDNNFYTPTNSTTACKGALSMKESIINDCISQNVDKFFMSFYVLFLNELSDWVNNGRPYRIVFQVPESYRASRVDEILTLFISEISNKYPRIKIKEEGGTQITSNDTIHKYYNRLLKIPVICSHETIKETIRTNMKFEFEKKYPGYTIDYDDYKGKRSLYLIVEKKL